MDQATQSNKEVIELKSEIYDLNKTINQQAGIIVAVCEKLGVSVAEGLNPQDLLDKIEELKGE